jgi:ribosomal protein S15P/S13E
MPHVPKPAAQAWSRFFASVPDLLRAEFHKRIQFEPDGSGHPGLLAMRDAFYAFPVFTDILLLDSGGRTLQSGEERFWTLLNFDFSVTGGDLVRFHGTVSASAIERHATLLETHFSLHAYDIDSLRGLLLMGQQYENSIVHLVAYNAQDQLERYSAELASCLLLHTERLCGLFRKQADFNERYSTEPDPILDASSLLKIHSTTAHFVDPTAGGPLTLEKLQAEVSQIQFIPQVPEDIRRTFYLAKRLYVFGYFEYGFFTVSLHYAYAAMEASLHARWSAALRIPTVLTYTDKGKVEVEAFGGGPAKYHGIRSLCKTKGWQVRKLKVNGEQFPYNATQVLDSLRKLGIITDWQRKRFAWWLRLRNYHSHLEFAPIETPTTDALVQVAGEINQLFDSLPLPT